MPHFLVSDDMSFNAKVVAAGNGAIGLWTRAGAWSQHPANLTEGFIPTAIARSMGTPGQIKKLVQVGLWIEVPGGYQFHEFVGPGRHRSREEILKLREDRARAGRTGGSRSKPSRRGQSEANAEASASPQPVDNSEEISRVRFSCEPTAIEKNSADSAIESALPADTPNEAEASAQANGKQNRTPIPIPIDSGDVGRERYVSNARDFSNGPPEFHPGHEDGRVTGCDECAAVQAAREAYLVAWAQTVPEPPPTRCDEHRDATGFVPACGPCRTARKRFERWEASRAEARRAAAQHEQASRAECNLCDETGWRIPPPELTYADPPAAKCDHTTRMPADWRRLIAALIDQTEESKTHV